MIPVEISTDTAITRENLFNGVSMDTKFPPTAYYKNGMWCTLLICVFEICFVVMALNTSASPQKSFLGHISRLLRHFGKLAALEIYDFIIDGTISVLSFRRPFALGSGAEKSKLVHATLIWNLRCCLPFSFSWT